MILTPELIEIGNDWKVLRDRLLVKILPYEHPVLLTPGVEVQKGVVIGAGYGRRVRRKVAFNAGMNQQQNAKTLYFEDGTETGKVLPMQVAVGDVIEFSFRNITLVDFDRLGYDGIGHLAFVWQNAVYSVDPDEALDQCMMWQQSAGMDRHGNFMSGAEDWHRA